MDPMQNRNLHSLHYYYTLLFSSQLTPHWGFSVTDYIKYYAYLQYGCSKLISTGVNNVVRPTMNKLSTMLFQVVTVEQCRNNMLTILFIVGRSTSLFTAVDINLEQVVDLLNFYPCSIDYLSLQQLWYYFPNCVYPNEPCQLSLWEETGAPGENRQSVDTQTIFTWVRSENQTQVVRGERRLLWHLRHRSSFTLKFAAEIPYKCIYIAKTKFAKRRTSRSECPNIV
jgi:hypothetical protein